MPDTKDTMWRERLLLAMTAAFMWKRLKKQRDISNSQMENLINEWIHSERDRKLLKRHLIDGICIEPLSEEADLSPRQTYRILKKAKSTLMKHI